MEKQENKLIFYLFIFFLVHDWAESTSRSLVIKQAQLSTDTQNNASISSIMCTQVP